jgi:ABC-2 type transport system ATP-binding protein
MQMEKSAIVVENLSKSYGARRSLQGLSFRVPLGSISGFVGPNGSGKTTTIRTLLGLVKATSGEAHVLGHHINKPGAYLDRVGAMIEGPAFYPMLGARENLHIFATMSGVRNLNYGELLESVGLAGKGNDKYKTFSLGMKQRLGIAAALVASPDLLILDEPTNGLDPDGITEIRNLIQSLARQGRTIFISSHLLAELEILCNYFVIIKAGQLIFEGYSQALLQSESGELVVQPEFAVDLSALLAIAIRHDFPASIQAGSLHIEGAATYAADFNRWASEDQIYLKSLHVNSSTLEEKFFDMSAQSS